MNNKTTAKKASAPVKKKTTEVAVVIVPEQPNRPLTTILVDFMDFLREQGVIGLAIAVVLGAAVTRLVGAFVADIINPVIGVLVGAAGDLASMVLKVGPIEIRWGSFVSAMIDFVVVASVVYFLVRILKLDRIDKKKS